MRLGFIAGLAVAAVIALGCATPAPGWNGTGVHLVDRTWIGVEQDCASGAQDRDLECRTVRDEVLRTLPAAVRVQVIRAAVAILPTTYVTASGETRTARLRLGIAGYQAVVIDLTDGTRRVIGALCSLPSNGTGQLQLADARCDPEPLDWWIDGGAPPSIPPGAIFG